ncbi:bacillithiol biosynthesis deacetylase BshB2 [Paenibacillus sp. KQZ6P-2]|uniref:Bacillithiol biosynthesis deacetylase BshB2 n=1 Tax=Paenibacillus mangrovi TaxID=2931978 RepID=A0A9X2B4S3_9BACL|nr:bacillithiol biosynthesis deacetylase BshB2 [Paenibacillus mangrovi]MCJ8014280.1 bacillithiol biosynthesis deacetylase BshB2 [Paenibacillus mangrovi]
MENHILMVFPHPDDESFGASGTLAKRIHEGAKVTYACLTLGEMARNMGKPLMANRITLPELRRRELAESARSIGIQDVRLMGLHDKTIEFEDQNMLDDMLRDLIDEVKPSLIITFYPGYSVHPDHDATGAAVIRTVSAMPKEQRPVVNCVAFSKGCEKILGKPDVLVDVRDFLPNKYGSIRAHSSQFRWKDMLGSYSENDEQIKSRFSTERFWTYHFE